MSMAIAQAQLTLCTVEEARELTARIASSASELWSLLLEAHDRKAWKALGYETWDAYVTTEFRMDRSYAFRLLNQGRVIAALNGTSPTGDIPERHARELTPLLPDPPLLQAVWAEVTEEAERTKQPVTAKVVRDAVRQHIRSEAALAEQELEEATAWMTEEQKAPLRPDRLLEWGRVLSCARSLLKHVPEPETFVTTHARDLPETFLPEIKAADAWLRNVIAQLEDRNCSI